MDNFVDLFLNSRTQNCEAKNLKGLADLITFYNFPSS